ncbi:MAG: 3-hydroxyacyl-CoA dehydrogenase family protein [Chloroflexota bacterium]|nr:3-hydroxyacyl-CoA dehydrogenase family protein [Chloroflexota bacterium]
MVREGQEDAVWRVAVVGAGFMGGGIAAELALRAAAVETVRLWDPVAGAAQRAVERAQDVAQSLIHAGVLSAEQAAARLGRMTAAHTLEEAVAGVAYVAEAAPEDLAVKQELFRRLDVVAPAEAVLASNTSGYDPADLSQGVAHPERVLVAHYFGPAYLIPLVEVVPHRKTAEWAVERTLALLASAGKRPVRLGKFAPGFVANRLQQALFREALSLVRQGVATPEAIDEVARFSFGPRLAALGPFTVADFAGHDVYASLARSVWPTLSTEFSVPSGAAPGGAAPAGSAAAALPPELAAGVAAGRLGTKSGAGFYAWPESRLRRVTARRDQALAEALRQDETREEPAEGAPEGAPESAPEGAAEEAGDDAPDGARAKE